MAYNESYKESHEAFVSGHTGTSVSEISLLGLSLPMSVCLRNALYYCLSDNVGGMNVRLKFVLDFIILMMPMVFFFTILSDIVVPLLISMCIIIITIFGLTCCQNIPTAKKFTHLLDIPMAGRRPFLTHYRALVNAVTAVCILAVDFAVFPRRFCKTETYGTGLMDVGVGAFIFSNAVVSLEARDLKNKMRLGKVAHITKSLTSTGPLWLLGLCRLVSVKMSGYHEHVTEYGIHWNFFFTLAVIRVLSTAVICAVNVRWSWLIAIAIISSYQFVLSYCGLGNYVLDDSISRVGLFEANREGICSCFGYLALYFAGVHFGRFLLNARFVVRDWVIVLAVLVAADLFFWALYIGSDIAIDHTSRRLANLTFVIWMVAHSLQVMASLLVADILHVIHSASVGTSAAINMGDHTKPIPFDLLESINFNGLFYFLLANLLTGFVNLTTYPMYASPVTALTELTLYMFVLSAVVAILHVYNILLKFW